MPEDTGPKAVLIVEDDDGWARLIGDEITDAGFDYHWARTVEDARVTLEEREDISLVVLDVLFGRTLEPLGIKFARWMKESRKWRNIPIFFCSVVSGAEIHAELKGTMTGSDVIFEKPFDFTEFSERLKAVLGKEVR